MRTTNVEVQSPRHTAAQSQFLVFVPQIGNLSCYYTYIKLQNLSTTALSSPVSFIVFSISLLLPLSVSFSPISPLRPLIKVQVPVCQVFFQTRQTVTAPKKKKSKSSGCFQQLSLIFCLFTHVLSVQKTLSSAAHAHPQSLCHHVTPVPRLSSFYYQEVVLLACRSLSLLMVWTHMAAYTVLRVY